MRSPQTLARETRAAWPLTVVALLSAPIVGAAIVGERWLLAFVPVAGVAALATLPVLTLAGWCGLILLLAVASRGVVTLLGLPEALNFLHYPAILAFAAVSALRPAPPTRSPAAPWIGGLLGVAVLSALANSTEPLRVVLFLAIVGEPLVLIWAVHRWGPTEATERRFGRFAVLLLAIQVPLGVWQGLTMAWHDPVRGTLVGHNAGAHVLGGLFALGAFVALADAFDGRRSWLTTTGLLAVAFGMLWATGSAQVMLAAGAALPITVLAWRGSRRSALEQSARAPVRRRRTISRAIVTALAVLVPISAPFWAELAIPGVLDRAEQLARPGELTETEFALDRARTEPLQLLIGSGPGTTASRAALLLTPKYGSDSIVRQLPLEPTDLAVRFSLQTRNPFGGSAEAAPSSILGLVGDLGLVGIFALLLFLLGVVRASRRAGSWLTPAVLGLVMMVLALSFVDNWLEYPEFTIPLALVFAFATSPRVPSPSPASSAVGHRHA